MVRTGKNWLISFRKLWKSSTLTTFETICHFLCILIETDLTRSKTNFVYDIVSTRILVCTRTKSRIWFPASTASPSASIKRHGKSSTSVNNICWSGTNKRE
jgi:hypothetical protein